MSSKEIIVIDDKDNLIQILIKLASDENNVFRGYSMQDQLNPSLIRNSVVNLENKLLDAFEKYASQYINATNPIDFMSHAQHFGLSTRLIDFTYNPFVALYFAMYKAKPNNAKEPDDNIYYYIRYTSLKDNICLREFPQELAKDAVKDEQYSPFPAGINSSKAADCERWSSWFSTYFSNADIDPELLESRNIIGLNEKGINFVEKLKQKPILFFDPNQSNQRLIMQQGLFMYPYSLEVDEHISIIKRNTTLIKIHKKVRKDMQAYLDKIGIDAFRLMPDLSSVCAAVERSVKGN